MNGVRLKSKWPGTESFQPYRLFLHSRGCLIEIEFAGTGQWFHNSSSEARKERGREGQQKGHATHKDREIKEEGNRENCRSQDYFAVFLCFFFAVFF